jgi:hypothetical protein
MVAFTLLTSVLAFSTPLIVRHKRLVAAQRDYRLALDEASNQIERLSVVPPKQIAEAVDSLQPSAFAAARLPAVKVEGKIEPVDLGHRITVSVSWGDGQRAAMPVTLAAWALNAATSPTNSTEPRSSP